MNLTESSHNQARDPVDPLCQNCHSRLQGAYCSNCGQSRESPLRSFPQTIRLCLSSVFDLDARVYRSLALLATRPGKLSQEYIQGRRARYLSPFKILIVLYLLLFSIAKLSISGYMLPELPEGPPEQVALTSEKHNLGAPQTVIPTNQVGLAEQRKPNAYKGEVVILGISVDDQKVKDFVGAFPRLYKTHRKELLEGLFDNAVWALLIQVPFAAMLGYLSRPKHRMLFTEHLIVSTHNHAFLALFSAVALIFDIFVLNKYASFELRVIVSTLAWLLPIFYVLRSQRLVFGPPGVLQSLVNAFCGFLYFCFSALVFSLLLVLNSGLLALVEGW